MNLKDNISKRAMSVDGSGIRRAAAKVFNIINPINLSIGQPDFLVDNIIKKSAIDSINNNKNGYTPTAGIDDLKNKIISNHKYANTHKENIDILITSGVTAGIFLSITTCLNPGDEIIIPDPYFLQYVEACKILEVNPIFMDTYPDFSITAEKMEKLITQKTKAIIINSPNNPTGVIIPNEELQKIISLAYEKNIFVIYDEIYSDFIYTNKSPHTLPFFENLIILNGFSKSYAMTGWRIGYVVAAPLIIEKMTRMQGQIYVSAASPAQYGAMEAFNADTQPVIQEYKERHKLVQDILSENFNLSKSIGSYYYFVEVPKKINMTSEKFCELVAQYRVIIIPGNVFSQKDTHFRLSFCVDKTKLTEGLLILNNIVKGYI